MGAYDFLILSARQSDGFETDLRRSTLRAALGAFVPFRSRTQTSASCSPRGSGPRSVHRDVFTTQVRKQNGRVALTEFARDRSWCDPCAADPLAGAEPRKLGVL